MQTEEIAERVAAFSQWGYELDLDGVRTPIFDAMDITRAPERARYFFEPLLALCGGTLEGKRVLDLGCNAGYWSLLAAEAGAEHVLGIDGRQMHVDQSELVFEIKGIARDRYEFMCANVFDADLEGRQFDIVLCLGLMYHVSKPMELLELISKVNTDIAVIDTELSRLPGRYFEFEAESLDEPRDSVDYRFALWPTRAAVLELTQQFGYATTILKPEFREWRGSLDYRYGFRRAFLCAKRTSLNDVPAERVSRMTVLTDVVAWISWQTWKAAKRPRLRNIHLPRGR
jgi:SAM-dependent methyltransferase